MKHGLFTYTRLVCLLAAAACLASCEKEIATKDPVEFVELSSEKVSFAVDIAPMSTNVTKSLLTDPAIENKVSGVTIAVYHDGVLEDTAYNLSLSGISFSLLSGWTYNVYALVNMGDMTSFFPADESNVGQMVYSIPSYNESSNSINSLGIPMSGMSSYTVSALSPTCDITVRRLLAKVTSSLSCDWAGARIKSAKVYNMNGRLLPFSSSAATGPSDLLSFQEVESVTGTGATSMVATLYVPENIQGTISGITASKDKAPETASVDAVKAKLTYLEVLVESTGKYEGEVVYRTYLGRNATDNFSIEGNKRYAWTIHYFSDRVDDFEDCWKVDMDGMGVYDYSLSLTPASRTVSVSESFSYTTTLNRIALYPSSSVSSTTVPNGQVNWSSSDASVAEVSSMGVVTGKAAGTATITASYQPSGYDFSMRSATSVVTVEDVNHYLDITAASLSSDYTNPIQLTAKYHTVTGGVDDGGVDVTTLSSTSWTKVSGSDVVSVGLHTGTVTASNYGSAVIRATHNDGTAVYTDEMTVTFNREDRSLVLSYSPASPVASVDNVQMSASLHTVVNGTPVDTPLAAGDVNWSVISSTNSGAVTSVSAAGVLTSSKTSTVTVSAVLKSDTSVSGTVDVTFAPHVTHVLQIVGSPSAQVGQNINLTAQFVTFTDGVQSTTNVNATWTKISGSASISVNGSGVVSATSEGSAVIRASYTYQSVEYTATITVTFTNDVSHRLVLSASSASVPYNGTIQLTATYYTTTNGVEDSGVNVTTSASFNKSGGSNVSVNGSGVVRLSDPSLSVVANNQATFTASYAGETSNDVSVEFTNVTSYVYTRLVVSGDSSVSVGGNTGSYSATLYTQTKVNGVNSGSPVSSDVSTSASFSSSSTSVATVSGRQAHGVSAGTTYISASYSGTYGSISSATADRVQLTVTDVVSHRLVLSASSTSVPYNGSITLTARYYTTTNGVEDSGVNVTPSSLTKTSGGSNITLAVGNPSTATLTNPALAVAANNRATVTATYAGVTSSAISIEFTNVTSYVYTRLVVSGDSSVSVGGNTGNYSATLYTQTKVNGVNSGSPVSSDVSTSASFSSSSTSVATMSGRLAHGVSAGTTYISASYTGTYGSISSDTADRVQLTVTNEVSHRLVLSANSTSVPYNGSITLTARYYTTTNGVEDSGVNVTPSSLTKTSGGSNITLTVGNPSTASLTNPALSVVANNRATVTATYAGVTSSAISIEFTNVTSYVYTRLVVSGDSSVSVGGNTGNYSATLYTQTVVNGVNSGSPASSDVSTSASFSSSSTSVATMSVRQAHGMSAGTTYISASYTGTYGSISSDTADRVQLTVRNSYSLYISAPSSVIAKDASQTYTVYLVTNGVRATSPLSSGVTWSCTTLSGGGAATITSSGVLTATALGKVTVTARYTPSGSSEISASVTLTISQGIGFDDDWDDDDGGSEEEL